MWQLVDGRLVFTPKTTHTRTALGYGHVPDTVTLITNTR